MATGWWCSCENRPRPADHIESVVYNLFLLSLLTNIAFRSCCCCFAIAFENKNKSSHSRAFVGSAARFYFIFAVFKLENANKTKCPSRARCSATCLVVTSTFFLFSFAPQIRLEYMHTSGEAVIEREAARLMTLRELSAHRRTSEQSRLPTAFCATDSRYVQLFLSNRCSKLINHIDASFRRTIVKCLLTFGNLNWSENLIKPAIERSHPNCLTHIKKSKSESSSSPTSWFNCNRVRRPERDARARNEKQHTKAQLSDHPLHSNKGQEQIFSFFRQLTKLFQQPIRWKTSPRRHRQPPKDKCTLPWRICNHSLR